MSIVGLADLHVPEGPITVVVGARDPGMRYLLSCTFGSPRFHVFEEHTELGVLSQTRISGATLVILDAQLADGSGFDACRRIKTNYRSSGARVIVLSGDISAVERLRAAAAGADVFLTKPFSPLRLARAALEQVVASQQLPEPPAAVSVCMARADHVVDAVGSERFRRLPIPDPAALALPSSGH